MLVHRSHWRFRMRSVLHRSLFILVMLMLISTTSFANLRKGKIGSGASRQFSYRPDFNGTNLLTLIYDAAATDLDLIIADSNGEIIAIGFSPESFSEILQVGLTNNDTFIVVVDSFEGPATPFRLVATNGQQQVIGAGTESGNLREVELNSTGKKMRDHLRKVARSKK